MSTAHKIVTCFLLLAASLMLVGCPPRTSVRDINRDPGRYANKDISVAGRVTNSFGALGTGVYEIDDGTGRIWVYSQSYGVPGSGAKVGVTGRINQGFAVGGRSFAVILRETERRH